MTVRQSTIMQYKTTTWSIFITDVQLRQEHNHCEPDAHYAVVKVTLWKSRPLFFQFTKSIFNIFYVRWGMWNIEGMCPRKH